MFEESVSSIRSIFLQHYSVSSPSLQQSLYAAVSRVGVILKTRYTSPGFWIAGLKLFQEAEELVSNALEKKHLRSCISQAQEQLVEIDNPTDRVSNNRGYLFEGHLTVDPEPPQPAWLVQSNLLTAAATLFEGESSREQTASNSGGVAANLQQNNLFQELMDSLDSIVPEFLDDGSSAPRVPPASKKVVAKLPVIEEEIPESQPKPTTTTDYTSDGYETASETELNDTVSQPENQVSETELIHEKSIEKANDAKAEGNSFFKDGFFEEALEKYAFAIQIATDVPETSEIRSICFANRAACFSKLGKLEETIKECTKALELNPTYMKALIRRAEAREKLEHYDESITDLTKILELDPSNSQARRSMVRIKPLADAKREKMKEEMIGKLKEMGNSVLGRFGMSVDNFKAVQDPNTGSYSVSFQR